MGCGTSNDVVPNDQPTESSDKSQFPRSPNLKRDYPIAFEVPFDDLETGAKKPLPQKLQRLQEQQSPEPEETMKMLQKRLAEADQRRQQILIMRVNSAQQFQQKNRTATSNEFPSKK